MLFILILTISVQICVTIAEDCIVEIPNGKIHGSFNGNYCSFKGIAYAESPTRENRFESPKPYIQTWDGVRDATQSGQTCIRLDPVIEANKIVLTGSEDCLFINVYTPQINADKLLPVIFFIHGGGFMFGSGDFLDEKFIMRNSTFIFVTFNYRLGAFGFMSTEDDQITGNMGLKDQMLALRWTHDNIKAFGGNPQQILMTGFSAGAASVEILLLQPQIEELVKAAYSISGSALCPWAVRSGSLKNVRKVAEILNCSDTTSTLRIKQCLKKARAEDLVNSSKAFFIFNYHPIVVWGPTVESVKSSDAILLERPEELIKNGKIGNIPYLSSYTSDDGAFINAELVYKKNDGSMDLEYFNKNYKTLLPLMAFYNDKFEYQSDIDKYTESLYKEVGLIDGIVTIKNFEKLTKLTTEVVMKSCITKSWKMHQQHSSSNTYSYLYQNPSDYSLANFMANRTDINFGCVHGDDAFLMFGTPLKTKLTEVEQKYFENFLSMLQFFATTGVPKFGGINLPENNKSSENFRYMHILKDNVGIQNL